MVNEVYVTKKFYEKNISIEDFYTQAEYFNLNDPDTIQREVSLFDFKKGHSVLEVGSGYGRLVSEIKSKGVEYTGIDFVQEYVRFCEDKFPETKFILADFFVNTFHNSYDRIIFPWTVLGHYDFPAQKEAIEKALGLLKRDGLIFVSFRRKNDINKKDYPKGSVVKKTKLGFKIKLHLVNDESKELTFFNSNKIFFEDLCSGLGLNLYFKELNLRNQKAISYAVLSRR